jgi:uncharacterized BrkB/YihY/UPF0761 family membrane protein
MLVVRPASEAYLPRALEASADQYGSIGVAFTYLAVLYVFSFIFLAAAIIGNVIAEEQGRLGQFIRRGGADSDERPAPTFRGPRQGMTCLSTYPWYVWSLPGDP